MSAPIKVGLIGYGFSTKCFHVPFIQPNPDLEIVAFLQRAEAPTESDVEAGKHCTIDHPKAKHYRTADDFFADKDIDLVVICSHHDTHADFAERALTSGKHVVVEKPFTRTAEEADRVIGTAKKSGKILTVYQNRRYDSDFRTLRTLISTKSALGQMTECELHYDVDFPFWMQGWPTIYSPGDGMMYGLGAHTIDQALLLFGPPSRVTGFHRSLRTDQPTDVDDSFTVFLEYGGDDHNLLVTIKTSAVTPMQTPLKYFARGRDGSFVKHGEDVQQDQIMDSGMSPSDARYGVEPAEQDGLLVTKDKIHESQVKDEKSKRYIGKYPTEKGDYLDYYRDVVAAIKAEKELVVKPEESRNVIRVIELARQSAKEKRSISWS